MPKSINLHNRLVKFLKALPKRDLSFFIVIGQAILIVIAFRSLFFEPYHIPSSSMNPNLLIGDKLFVNKMIYGYSKFSFPFHLFDFKDRIVGYRKPRRGEIVVFTVPADTDIYYIKRIIGLPGDKVQVISGVVYVNNKPMQRRLLPSNHKSGVADNVLNAMRYLEINSDGLSYEVYISNPDSEVNNTDAFYVPEGHYFMMGDNRDDSMDSRVNLGYVPYGNIVGRAELIFYSSPDPIYNLFSSLWHIRWHSMFSSLVPRPVE